MSIDAQKPVALAGPDRALVEDFAARVRDLYPEARIWLHGSRARGDAGPDSDWDVAVVLDEFDATRRRTISGIGYDVRFDRDQQIHSVVLARERFEGRPWRSSGIVMSIQREGILL